MLTIWRGLWLRWVRIRTSRPHSSRVMRGGSCIVGGTWTINLISTGVVLLCINICRWGRMNGACIYWTLRRLLVINRTVLINRRITWRIILWHSWRNITTIRCVRRILMSLWGLISRTVGGVSRTLVNRSNTTSTMVICRRKVISLSWIMSRSKLRMTWCLKV